MTARALVSLVDDDVSVRDALSGVLQHAGLAVRAFDSAEAFLAADVAPAARCLILDIALPGMSGPDLQREIERRGRCPPIVFITAKEDEALGARLLAAGAAACLLKPFDDTALLEAVAWALRRS